MAGSVNGIMVQQREAAPTEKENQYSLMILSVLLASG